jgi:hypothetical protein
MAVARGDFSTFAAMSLPRSVKAKGNEGENFSFWPWSQIATT